MRALVSAVAAGAVSLVGADVAYATGPDWLLGLPLKYWIDIIVLLLILNLVCCWRRRR
jgi:hypothetical protein